MTSRAIFQRMRSYSLYRITSTIHFLLFLFIAIIAFDFTIPAVLIVLITVMNDAATLVISVDNAQISKRPDKWRIGQLIFLSFVLAILLALASFAHFFIFKYAIGWDDDKLGTVMYLQMSSCPHFVIFSTRLPGPFWVKPPSWIFFVAVMGTQVVAMVIPNTHYHTALSRPWCSIPLLYHTPSLCRFVMSRFDTHTTLALPILRLCALLSSSLLSTVCCLLPLAGRPLSLSWECHSSTSCCSTK